MRDLAERLARPTERDKRNPNGEQQTGSVACETEMRISDGPTCLSLRSGATLTDRTESTIGLDDAGYTDWRMQRGSEDAYRGHTGTADGRGGVDNATTLWSAGQMTTARKGLT